MLFFFPRFKRNPLNINFSYPAIFFFSLPAMEPLSCFLHGVVKVEYITEVRRSQSPAVLIERIDVAVSVGRFGCGFLKASEAALEPHITRLSPGHGAEPHLRGPGPRLSFSTLVTDLRVEESSLVVLLSAVFRVRCLQTNNGQNPPHSRNLNDPHGIFYHAGESQSTPLQIFIFHPRLQLSCLAILSIRKMEGKKKKKINRSPDCGKFSPVVYSLRLRRGKNEQKCQQLWISAECVTSQRANIHKWRYVNDDTSHQGLFFPHKMFLSVSLLILGDL